MTAEEPCPVCQPIANATGRDLDLDYETSEQAYTAFNDITSEEGLDTLLEHTKEYYNDTITAQNVTRDKAKLLLGTTSFTLAVLSGGVALLKESFNNAPPGLVVLMALLFFVIAIHFARALVFASDCITREITCAVSTQDVLGAVALSEPGSSDFKRRLAAHYRSAATQTAQYLTKRKSDLMLAQGCLKWGLFLMPFLFFCSLLAAYLTLKTDTPAWAKPLAKSVDGLLEEQATSRTQVDSLRSRLANLESTGLSGRLRDLESQFRDAEQRYRRGLQELNGLAVSTQSAQADLRVELERGRDNSRKLHALVELLPERINRVEEQVDKAKGQIQALVKSGRNTSDAPGDKN